MIIVTTDDDAKKNISANLSWLLDHRGMSQVELATLTGDTPMSISRYVRGMCLPSAGALARIAEAFRLPMDALVASPKKNPKRRLAS